MAKRRYDVSVAEKRDDKTYWKKIGVVLQTDKGGFALKIEMLPVGWDGWAQLFEPKEDDKRPERKTQDSDGAPF